MPMVLNSPMVGDWKSLLSNFGGTGPVPTTGRPLLEEGVVGILVIGGVGEGLEDAAVAVAVKGMEGERLAAEAVVGEVVVAGGTGGEGELMEEGGERGKREKIGYFYYCADFHEWQVLWVIRYASIPDMDELLLKHSSHPPSGKRIGNIGNC